MPALGFSETYGQKTTESLRHALLDNGSIFPFYFHASGDNDISWLKERFADAVTVQVTELRIVSIAGKPTNESQWDAWGYNPEGAVA